MLRSWDFANNCEKKGDFDGMFTSFKKWFDGDVMRFYQKKQVSFDGNLLVIALTVI